MGLLRLELENFKSYLGMHVVGPFDRFTSIVGPNGSGKSNIMDAITFCLGVGATHLRSSSGKGLIHRGCAHARVSLFMDDGAVLGRQVSDAGRNTYFVNGEAVAHSQFHAFLEDMNILPHARNFLVFQGDVSGIANMGPAELALLFEDMSGSIALRDEYDRMFSVQHKALGECSALFEEKREIGARMREAKEVQDQEHAFRMLVERKAQIQREMLLHRLHSRIGQIRSLDGEISVLRGGERDMQRLLDVRERDVDACRARAEDAQRRFFETENRVCQARERVDEARLAVYEAEQGQEKSRMRRMELEMELRTRMDCRDERERELARRKRELEAVEQGYAILCRDEAERKRRLDMETVDLEGHEEKLRRMVGGDLDALGMLDLEMFPKKTQREHLSVRLRDLKTREEGLREQMREKGALKKNIVLKIGALEKSEHNLQERIHSAESRYERIAEEEREKNRQLEEVLQGILRTRGQRRASARRAAVQSAVETLGTIFPGVHGRVVDLVRPTQHKYELALSVLLGLNDQAVVVDSEATAMSCISFIREKRLCRMTFLPLHSIQAPEGARISVDGARPAADTVSCDAKYEKIVRFLFRDSLVADSMDAAREICYGKGIAANVCTLDGVYFHGKGRFITGGGVRESRFEESEAEMLIRRRIRLLDELKQIQESKSSFSHVEISRERMAVWRESRTRESEVLAGISAETEELEKKLRHNQTQQKGAEQALHAVEEDLEMSGRATEDLRKRVEDAETRVFEGVFPNAGFRSYREYRECREDVSFAQREMEHEGVRSRTMFRIQVLEQESACLQQEMERIRSEMDSLAMECSADLLPETDGEVAMLENERMERLAEFECIKEELRDINNAFRELVSRKNELDKSIIYASSTRTRLDEEVRESLSFAVLEEIDIPGMHAGPVEPSSIDFSGLHGSVDDLKRELDQISQRINEQIPLIRIEEKSTDQARYIKVSAEYERLKEAAMDAKRIFNDVRRRRTDMFMECFEKVNREIARVYRDLTMTDTSEGSACLVLENPAEPFKDGIRFHLMPPNKRFREVRMLSGGEKTMAVLSLLLALRVHRPPPFYVLDEIDAALDRTNVSRVVSFMASCDMQFIVISHKPSLFQHSDGLVGVYKDQGVSRILTYRPGN